jgi:FADH2 O2-dependent halogenase
MLRFLGGRTSVGFVNAFPGEQPKPPRCAQALRQEWDALTQRYPSVAKLLVEARLIDPRDGEQRPVLHSVHRMSRCRSHACGPGWVCLPVAAGFVDPLHSFGIAHSLSGIVRIAEGLLGSSTQQRQWLENYSQEVRREIDWFDVLISGSYRGLPSDRRFMAFAAFYFAAAIAFEKQMALDPSHWPTGYMSAADERLRAVAQDAWTSMGAASDVDEERLIERMRTAIRPWNDVGLLEPSMRNRLDHTAPPKRMAMMLSGMAGA